MQSKGTTLRILLVSDIHQRIDYLSKVKQWYFHKSKYIPFEFDYVLVPGDMGTVDYSQSVSQNQQVQSQAVLVNILKQLEVYNCPILYLPGNHDCQAAFKSESLTCKSHNIHKKDYELTEGLKIKGLGGSVPGFCDGKLVWQGYPYNSDLELALDFDPLVSQKDSAQLLLVTHVGPTHSQTTVDCAHAQYIESGSDAIRMYIEKRPSNLLLNIHGHTHQGVGVNQYKGVTILNPGSVKEGRFGVLTLSKKQGRWGVQSIDLLNLNYL